MKIICADLVCNLTFPADQHGRPTWRRGGSARWRAWRACRQTASRAPVPPGSQTHFSPLALASRVPVRAGELQFFVESGDPSKERRSPGSATIHRDRWVKTHTMRTHVARRVARVFRGDLSPKNGMRRLRISLGCSGRSVYERGGKRLSASAVLTSAARTFYSGIFLLTDDRAVNSTVERTCARGRAKVESSFGSRGRITRGICLGSPFTARTRPEDQRGLPAARHQNKVPSRLSRKVTSVGTRPPALRAANAGRFSRGLRSSRFGPKFGIVLAFCLPGPPVFTCACPRTLVFSLRDSEREDRLENTFLRYPFDGTERRGIRQHLCRER